MRSEASNITRYTVLDASGRVVLSEKIQGGANEIVFSVQQFENGTYILELETSVGTVAKPFVKK